MSNPRRYMVIFRDGQHPNVEVSDVIKVISDSVDVRMYGADNKRAIFIAPIEVVQYVHVVS